jgi:hypothetical protein
MAKRWNTGKPDAQDAAFLTHKNPSYPKTFNLNSRGRDRSRCGGRSNYRQQPYRFCKYRRCNIDGHTIEDCRKRIRDEEAARKEKNNRSAAKAASTQEKEDADNPDQHLNDDAYFSS